jgi:glycine C-acetyltransferase
MPNSELNKWIEEEITAIKTAGLFKKERIISSPLDVEIKLSDGQRLINFCANNYLGLSNHPDVKQAAIDTMNRYSYGISSDRFKYGTLDIQKELERALSDFIGQEDTILYAACFDANGRCLSAFFH